MREDEVERLTAELVEAHEEIRRLQDRAQTAEAQVEAVRELAGELTADEDFANATNTCGYIAGGFLAVLDEAVTADSRITAVLALADEAEAKGTTLRNMGEADIRLAGNAYVGMAQRIRTAVSPVGQT